MRFYHVLGGDKWIVNSDKLYIVPLESYSRDQAADSTESWSNNIKTTSINRSEQCRWSWSETERKLKNWEINSELKRRSSDIPLIPILILAICWLVKRELKTLLLNERKREWWDSWVGSEEKWAFEAYLKVCCKTRFCQKLVVWKAVSFLSWGKRNVLKNKREEKLKSMIYL